jgi:ABC-type glutathione transport system ATPase component
LPLLEVSGLTVSFEASRRSEPRVTAIADLDLEIDAGEMLALVGESGSGKTTLARSLVGLVEPTSGSIRFDGIELTGLKARELAAIRSRIGFVMQDSVTALNPRRTLLSSVSSPLGSSQSSDRKQREELAGHALERVGLSTGFGDKRPGELSGGQRQRAAIARAIVTEPELLICDEPLAGLDLMTEAHMLEVLKEATRDTACLFITHDLCLASEIGDRVAVMDQGHIVEEGPVGEVLSRPAHPHTRALIEAVPPADPDSAWRERHGIVRPVQPPLDAAT